MKVTNLETSQKLKELGFEAETNYYYFNKGSLLDYCSNLDEIEYSKPITKAYDLETILGALPRALEDGRFFSHITITYDLGMKIGYFEHGIELYQEKNESLANTAGHLLVKLLEDNIIKLGE